MRFPIADILTAARKKEEDVVAYVSRCQTWRKSAGIDAEDIPVRVADSMSAGMISALRTRYNEALKSGDQPKASTIARSILTRQKALHESPAYQESLQRMIGDTRQMQTSLSSDFDHASILRAEMAALIANLETAKKMRLTHFDLPADPRQLPPSELVIVLSEQVAAQIAPDAEAPKPDANRFREMGL